MDGGQQDAERTSELDGPPLDVSSMNEWSWKDLVGAVIFHRWTLWLLRHIWPIAWLPGFRLILRANDVREVLRADRIFHVDGVRVTKAGDGHNFLLGMQADEDAATPVCPYRASRAIASRAHGAEPTYNQYHALVTDTFPLRDLPRVAGIVRAHADRALEKAEGSAGSAAALHIDAVDAVITGSTLAVLRDYYGVRVPGRHAENFVDCTMAASHWLFHPDPAMSDKLAKPAIARIHQFIDRAIDSREPEDTIVRRLHAAGVERPVIRTTVLGMILGFVPTSTMACAHILEMLLDREDMLAHAVSAVRGPRANDDRLTRVLLEALRFKPLIREPLRICKKPYTLGAHRFEAESRVLAVTASAMMDPTYVSNPRRFDPDRPADDSLVFGYGLHRCVGAPLAKAHMLHSLKPLLSRSNLRRAPGALGKTQKLGPFPRKLEVWFDGKAGSVQ